MDFPDAATQEGAPPAPAIFLRAALIEADHEYPRSALPTAFDPLDRERDPPAEELNGFGVAPHAIDNVGSHGSASYRIVTQGTPTDGD